MIDNARSLAGAVVAAASLTLLSPAGVLAAGPSSGPPAASQPSGSTAPTTTTSSPATGIIRISDQKTTTYWAYTANAAVIHSAPQRSARAVGRLHYTTEDGLNEVYLALDKMTDDHGTHWLHITVPGRPNGRTGWVIASSLGPLHVNHEHMVINRGAERLTLYRNGRQIFSAPVGVGAPGTDTPAGKFWVREMFGGFNNAAYGPYAIGTSAYSPTLTDWPGGGVVGIHGTDQPNLIPGRPSHGCVRLKNSAVTQLYHVLQLGTPITIS
jgi:lipoprotein-anchoring transpeptidase ErfK/SrfK